MRALFLAQVLLATLVIPACTAPVGPVLAGQESPPPSSLQTEIAQYTVPAVVAVREAVQSVPVPIPEPVISNTVACDEQTTALIVRWEVTGKATYTRKYRGVIWPGGASGPTWAVGYDGGHQTRHTIASDWVQHDAVTRLQDTSGITGTTAQIRVKRGDWTGITTDYPYALQVFSEATLPSYTAAAKRAFGKDFVSLPCGARSGLTSLVYNRGGQMTGSRRTEMRHIRDVCIPANDMKCIAHQLEAMCRIWNGTPNGQGLCLRRRDEARTTLKEYPR